MRLKLAASALALALAACSQGGDIASPGTTTPTTPPGGGSGGGNGGGGSGSAECPASFTEGTAVAGLTTCNVSGTYLANVTLEAIDGLAYRLDGRVDIGSDTGADGNLAGGQSVTLTIEPGVTIFGESGSDYLVVNRGSQIVADGELAAPIVMTSADDLEARIRGAAESVEEAGEAHRARQRASREEAARAELERIKAELRARRGS